ncbi:MAG: acyltransferase family protein [Candidatus Nanopelagicaceae bacterium]
MISPMIGIGTIRFLLALAVLLLHADFVTFEVAQIAVLTFFFISGFLMEGAYRRYSSPGRFLINRALRLMPSLILVIFSTWMILVLSTEEFRRSFGFIYLRSATTYGRENPPPLSALASIEWDGAIPYLGFDSELVPQAWSVGNEMLYYVTIPFLAMMSRRWIASIAIASLTLLLVLLRSDYADFDYAVYTNLFATYIFFIMGYRLSKTWKIKIGGYARNGVRYLACGFIVATYFFDFPDTLSPLLVLSSAAFLISLITVGFLTSSQRVSDEGAPSKFLGKLSYPLYISHMMAIGLLNTWSILSIPTLIVFATMMATALYLVVDGPLEKVRSMVRD